MTSEQGNGYTNWSSTSLLKVYISLQNSPFRILKKIYIIFKKNIIYIIMKVNIIGAGIAGLTIALELIEHGFDITIYEKDKVAGGMARSGRIDGIATEHSWRGFMSFYYNIFNILKRIKLEPNIRSGSRSNKSNILLENFNERKINIDEVKLHNKPSDAWIIYQGYVYDITYFIDDHPGGIFINLALGNDVELIWKKYGVKWHMNNKEVIRHLTKNKIGKFIVKESFSSKNSRRKTLMDNLIPITMDMFYKTKSNKVHSYYRDIPYILYNYLKYLFGNKRNEIDYKTKILDIYNKDKVTKYTYDYFVTYVSGPGLGLDFNNGSIGMIYFYLTGYLKNYSTSFNSWYVMKKPTNEAFIDPLVNYLRSLGVKFNYNSELQKINYSKTNRIVSCLINGIEIYGDEFILAINPNNLSKIFKVSKMYNLEKIHNNLKITNNQISFRLGLKNKIKFKHDDRGYVLMDSINNITFYPQDNFFNVPIDKNNKIKSLWSGTCVQVYNNNLNINDFLENIIKQFLECQELQDEIKEYNNSYLYRDDIIYTELYDDWYFDNNKLKTKNKKWVNTYLNDQFKPNNWTEYNNLYLAGGHTNTSFKIWSMESSCESGKMTANLILKKYNKKLCYIYTHKKPIIAKLLQKLDDILYEHNQSSIVDYILWIIIIVIIINIIELKNVPFKKIK
jgi:uncharacterized protein with NAD-binding domain and iron-sulfur cluster